MENKDIYLIGIIVSSFWAVLTIINSVWVVFGFNCVFLIIFIIGYIKTRRKND